MIDDSTIKDVASSIFIEDVYDPKVLSSLKKEEKKEEEEFFNDINDEQLINTLADKIKELDKEWRNNPNKEEDMKSQHTMTELLSYIENEFGFECLKDVIHIISDDLGHPLALINKSYTKRLVREGWVHDKQNNEVRPMNDEELINLFNQPSSKRKIL